MGEGRLEMGKYFLVMCFLFDGFMGEEFLMCSGEVRYRVVNFISMGWGILFKVKIKKCFKMLVSSYGG